MSSLTHVVSPEGAPGGVEAVLTDGKVVLSTYVCNEDEWADPAVIAWGGEASSGIECRFSVMDLVECPYEYKKYGDEDLVSRDEKPLFDALRSELLAAVARIDGIKFD